MPQTTPRLILLVVFSFLTTLIFFAASRPAQAQVCGALGFSCGDKTAAPCCDPLVCTNGSCQPESGPVCATPGEDCTKLPCCGGSAFVCDKEDKVCVYSPPKDDGGDSADPELTCNDGSGINTAIGCIPIGNTIDFVGFFSNWAPGVGGGIAFLLILYAGFVITTSSGDPKKLQGGRELLTSAIAGLLLLIFAIFILQFIGIEILNIPWFGS
jgi:hypothetical protein